MPTRKFAVLIVAVLMLILGSYAVYRLRGYRPPAYQRQSQSAADETANLLNCIPIADAGAHANTKGCVSGQVMKVFTSRANNTFFDFCADYRNCPFSAVVFADDKPKFGDLAQFSGREIEIRGQITLYRNRAEIVIHDPSQIKMQQ